MARSERTLQRTAVGILSRAIAGSLILLACMQGHVFARTMLGERAESSRSSYPKATVHHPGSSRGSVQGGPRNPVCLPTEEFLLDTARVLRPASGSQDNARVAFDGTNYLVLWDDNRQGRVAVFGARISQDGSVLDSTGFRVLEDFVDPPVYVAYGHTCFLTAAVRMPVGPPFCQYRTIAARVMPDGTAPDVAGTNVTAQSPFPRACPTVVFGGTKFLLSWALSDGIHEAFVSTYGSAEQEFVIGSPSGLLSYTMAFGNDTFLMVYYTTAHDLMGIRLGSDGRPIDTLPFVISNASGDQSNPSVAYDGSNFIVAWQGSRPDSTYSGIYSCRVSRSGIVLDSGGIRTSSSGQDSYPTVAAMADRSLISWRRGGERALMCARLDANGALLDTSPIRLCHFPSVQKNARLAAGRSNFLAVWSDARGANGEVFCTVIDTSGAVMDSNGILVTQSANAQSHPAVEGNSLGYLAVWQDDAGGDILGTRVSPSGAVLDVPALAVSSASGTQSCPAVTRYDSAAGFLTVWQDGRGSSPAIFGARVTTVGEILDPQGIAISQPGATGLTPAAAWDGTNALVVWRNDNGIFGARVAPSGEVLDSNSTLIHGGATAGGPPAVAWDGQEFLVSWTTGAYLERSDVFGTRVSPDGVVLDSALHLAAWGYWQDQPSLAFGGPCFGLVVQDGSRTHLTGPHTYYYAYDIYLVCVLPSGEVQDTIPLQTDMCVQQTPFITFDGERFVTAWATYPSYEYDLEGRWLDTTGNVARSLPAIVCNDGDQLTPVLAHGPGHQVLLVYNGWAGVVDSVSYGTYRIWGKTLELTGIEEEHHSVLPRVLSNVRVGPVPAKNRVAIRYVLASPEPLSLRIFDCSGRLIHSESRSKNRPGEGAFVWDGDESRGGMSAGGAYFFILRAGPNDAASGRITLLR